MYPQTNENATAVLSLQSTGHPDTDYEPTLLEQIEAEPPPGWEEGMRDFDLERARREVRVADAAEAKAAYDWVRMQVGEVLMHTEAVGSQVFGGDDEIQTETYRVYLFPPASVNLIGHGTGDNYMEAARAAVLDLATRRAKGAA